MNTASYESPVGQITVYEDQGAITRLSWGAVVQGESSAITCAAIEQLRAYFDGQLKQFDLPLSVAGSEFQQEVCDIMAAIPFGDTLTYGDIAKMTGNSAQAVGNACGANPIPIIIPCHRVLGANGLGGFSGDGGVETKVNLLRLEGAAGLLI